MNTVKIPYKYADCDYRKKLMAFIHVGGGCTLEPPIVQGIESNIGNSV